MRDVAAAIDNYLGEAQVRVNRQVNYERSYGKVLRGHEDDELNLNQSM